jgi:hypothetical protein
VDKLLQAFTEAVYDNLIPNKPAIRTELEGVLGSLALFMDNSYISNISYENLSAKMFHMKSYLQCHYYYLINPVDINKWCFLIYKPIPGYEDLRIYSQDRMLDDWKSELTFFKAEEIIPFFACQSLTSSVSILSALKQGLTISDSKALATENTSNPSQSLDGYALEVLSTICIIEASQHGVGCVKSTFSGHFPSLEF